MKAVLDLETLLFGVVHKDSEEPSLWANMRHEIENYDSPLLMYWEEVEKTTYSTLGEVFNGSEDLYSWGFPKGELDNLELADSSFVLVETRETETTLGLGKVSKIVKESYLVEKAKKQENEILKYYSTMEGEIPFDLLTDNGDKINAYLSAKEALKMNEVA